MPQALSPLATFLEVQMKARGWSRRALAERAGISPNTLARVLDNASATPQSGTLSKIASVLNVTPQGLTTLATAESQFDAATNPTVAVVALSNAKLFAHWSPEEWDELISSFGVGGELSEDGVITTARQINDRRETVRQVMVLLETHLEEETRAAIRALYESLGVNSQ